ncbi:LysM peptidoglycan-binding domain-containing protein [Ruania suaedae]|uniref:LysM peptidoglycan-binding domain-containing protein n=1 Tax=Ruania suaedae TaxID=2897774 RepID=UPI001E352F87|nr:LysM peptidoglycan-binding domain-containing protein [Ruania suaedae]UFU04208.1 LysM peptidoglycan-binding domain-containing protein [Ruania suaedae]
MSALALPTPEFRPAPARPRHLVAVPELVPAPPTQDARSSADAATGPARLTRRGQVVLSLLAFVAAAALGSALGLALPADESAPAAVATVTVGAGESLWVVAEGVAAPGEDVRPVVEQIMALNGLTDSTVHTGQQLSVPAAG